MTYVTIPRIVIAGTSSGVGKTTIVTGLLAILKKQGFNVQSYKVGPDYIDPGFHYMANGKPAYNLDTWLVPQEKIVSMFAHSSVNNELVVIEGVMGLYDGGRSGVSSTAAIANMLEAPVVLIVDAKSMGESVAATVLGYKMYDTSVNLAGVIVNRLGSETHRTIVCNALERIGVKVLGCMYRNEKLALSERHLGLTPVTEADTSQTISAIASQMSTNINVEGIVDIARSAKPLPVSNDCFTLKNGGQYRARIGVAQDEAFSFYYPQSLEVLASLGAELIPFSPLHDQTIPNVGGLILGGGFPEMFVDRLAQNQSMRHSIYCAFKRNMPIYAECGGLMYLTRQITDFSGKAYDMVGAIPAVCMMESKLQTVGYVEATALTDTILCNSSETLRGHEFHFSRLQPDIDDFSSAFLMKKMRTGASYPGGYAKGNLLASYLHIHFAGNETAAIKFVESCQLYQKQRKMQTVAGEIPNGR